MRLNALRYDRSQIEKTAGLNCALYFNKLNYYTKETMLNEGIPFILEGKQVFLPFLGMLLSEKDDRRLVPVHTISFLTQKLILCALYEKWNDMNATKIAEKLGVTKMSVSRCLDEIEYLDIKILDKSGKTRKVSVSEEIRVLWEEIKPVLRNPVIARFQLAEDIPYKLYGDEGRIRQVLINILNNSIKFTKEGYVSIAVSSVYSNENEICLRFVIEDTGIGIKQEDMDSIFESFRQLDMNKNRKTEGTGLGLAITKKLVNLMQGDIQVESEYGSGTCFTIQIKQRVLDMRTVKDMPMTQHAAEAKKGQMFVCKNYRVLVVDDNVINRKVATAMLASYGFQIHEASSGKAAIELVKKNVYDMIFMDHMMPEMDGIETLNRMKALEQSLNRGTPVVALTANDMNNGKEFYLDAGFNGYLEKPVLPQKLEELIQIL